MPAFQIITEPKINWPRLYSLSRMALDRSISASCDSLPYEPKPGEQYIRSLMGLNEPDGEDWNPALYGHLCYGAAWVGTHAESLATVTCCPGMAIELTPAAGEQLLGIVTGSLGQWRDAIVCGTNHRGLGIQEAFCQLMRAFELRGLGPVWRDYHKTGSDLFRLEQA